MATSDQIGSSAAQYLQAIIQLMPLGKAWATANPNSNLVALLQVIADAVEQIDAQACLLVDEALPSTTQQLLPNWEETAGIPDACSVLGDTIQIRRQKLIGKLSSRGGQSIAYLEAILAQYGYDVTITEFTPFQCDISTVEDPICDQNWYFAFLVNAPGVAISYFRASNSAAGEPLATWGNTSLECIINRYKPAHTIALFEAPT